MKKTLSVAMGLLMAGVSGISSAEGLEFSGNVALTSDYVFRGVSQNDTDPAIQGGFDVAHDSGIYAGVWASNVDEAVYGTSSMEIDVYLGWGGDVGPVGLDVGYLRYNYPGTNFKANNTDEFHIGASADMGVASLGLTYNYSDNFFGAGNASYWDFGVEVPAGSLTLAAHYGITDYSDNARGTDYDDWSVGVSTELAGFGFDLSWTDTDLTPSSATTDGTVIFTVSKSL